MHKYLYQLIQQHAFATLTKFHNLLPFFGSTFYIFLATNDAIIIVMSHHSALEIAILIKAKRGAAAVSSCLFHWITKDVRYPHFMSLHFDKRRFDVEIRW